MASVTSQALLLQGANAVAARPGWHWPLSIAPDTPIWRDRSLFSDNAWLAVRAFTASVVPKSNTWQPPLSAPDYLKSHPLRSSITDASSFTGNWLSSAGIVPAATPAYIGWQQELSVSRVTKHPIWADESSYDGVAWFQAASIVSPAAGFLARTSGLDATHINAYTALINGLIADGIWAKLDVLHIYATQDSTTALLNLVSTSYNGTANGLPSFSIDLGYTGTSGSTTKYIDTGFNATTAISPHFTTNSAHVSYWPINNTFDTNCPMGVFNALGQGTFVNPRYSTGDAFYRINSQGVGGVATASSIGHHIANRSGGAASQGYKNGASVITDATGAVATQNNNFYTLAGNNQGTPGGGPWQIAMASIGESLDATQAGNFYTRLRTYMTAVGVP